MFLNTFVTGRKTNKWDSVVSWSTIYFYALMIVVILLQKLHKYRVLFFYTSIQHTTEANFFTYWLGF